MRPVFSILADRVLDDGCVALITVASTDGSTPREAGARMIVTPQGEIVGSVGGGTLEYRLITEAVAAMQNSQCQAEFRNVPLGPELGQCCGGRLTYIIEVFRSADHAMLVILAQSELQNEYFCEAKQIGAAHLERRSLEGIRQFESVVYDGGVMRELFRDTRSPLLLFGAGHVGRALILALAPLPFHTRWIDSREGAFPQLTPKNVTAIYSADIEAEITAAPKHALILIMTHSHALDLLIVSAGLRRADLPFIGLIGSTTKRARFMHRLTEAGMGDAARQRLVSPIGLTRITGKEPAVIAASIAADLLIRREALAKADLNSHDPQSFFSSITCEVHPHDR